VHPGWCGVFYRPPLPCQAPACGFFQNEVGFDYILSKLLKKKAKISYELRATSYELTGLCRTSY